MAFCPQNVEVCRQVSPLALLQPCQIVIISDTNFLKVLSMLKEEVLVFHCVKDHEVVASSDQGCIYLAAASPNPHHDYS